MECVIELECCSDLAGLERFFIILVERCSLVVILVERCSLVGLERFFIIRDIVSQRGC